MKSFRRVIVAFALIFALFIPNVGITSVYAAKTPTTPTGYTKAEDVKYVKVGNYIANWGVRDEKATFLSTYAEAFYTGSYVYSTMKNLSGGTTQSNASNSALYSSLKTLMTSKHSYKTDYNETRQMYKYTDCVNSDYSTVSSFYSATSLNGEWGSSPSWNREHTWPNSKGLGGQDETDIMMLRPTATSENSSRGNTAYGESGSYYDPNGEGQNLHGDCARIVLYVYTRWGNTSYMWGQSGVMQSMDVLLKWMAEDPVDTWEMGRNDAVQAITGTRNVFVDYPEYAWLLFGKEIPKGIITPSMSMACDHNNTVEVSYKAPTCTEDGNQAGVKCVDCGANITNAQKIPATGHNYDEEIITKQPTCSVAGSKSFTCLTCGETIAQSIPKTAHTFGSGTLTTQPTCTTDGVNTYTCSVCGESKTETIEAPGHNFEGGACSVCGEQKANVSAEGVVFELGADGSASHYDNSTSATSYTETVGGYTLNITGASNIYPNSRDAKGNGCLKVGSSGNAGSFSLTVPSDVVRVIFKVAQHKANATSIQVNGVTYTILTSSNNGEYTDIEVDTSVNKTISFATLSSGKRCMINSITFYGEANSGGGEVVPDNCEHTNTTELQAVSPTCTKTGLTAGSKCADCGEVLISQQIVAASGHAYENGTCTVCGATSSESSDAEIAELLAKDTLTVAEALKVLNSLDAGETTAKKYYVTGVIDEVYNAEYGDIYIKDDSTTDRLYLYGLFSEDGSISYSSMSVKPVVGDTIKVYGVLLNYKGNTGSSVLEMKAAWLIQHIPAGGNQGGNEGGNQGGSEQQPSDLEVVANPEAGVAYKFGMIQSNAGTDVYYLAGGMHATYYLATTIDSSAALDVYLESTNGGYYLYAMINGVKNYINCVVSADGEHVNAVYELTASTVYTYNTEKQTVITSVDGIDYLLGTKNDNSYTSIGPCKVSDDPFYAKFYAGSENNGGSGNEGGNNGNEGGNQGGNTDSSECNHRYGEWTTTKNPTTSETGEKVRECIYCGHVQTSIISAIVKYEDSSCNSTIDFGSIGMIALAVAGVIIDKKRRK